MHEHSFAPSWRTIVSITNHHHVTPRCAPAPLQSPQVEDKMEINVRQQGRNYSPNAKGNFQFERVITGWRGTPLVDWRLKK
jgi:hypothetical protein